MIKRLEAQVGQFHVGCKCPVSRGIVVQEQDHLGVFPSKFPSIAPAEMKILHVGSLALGKIINEENATLIPKNQIETRTFPADFCTRNYLGRGEPLCRHTIDRCFVSES